MTRFTFCGELPASKSLFNRWLVVGDYEPALQILGESNAEDIKLMRQGLKRLHEDAPVNCGSAGTVLRFLSLRASRLPGRHVLFGSPRLLSRPQNELASLLGQLGVQFKVRPEQIEIEGMGWQNPGVLHLDPSQSSQFASGLLLNSWNLDYPLQMKWEKPFVSEGYFQMTQKLVRQAGMEFVVGRGELMVPAQQRVQAQQVQVEADLSSTFSIAAIAAVAGSAEFVNFPFDSVQPDLAFMDILARMNVRLEYLPHALRVHRSENLKAVDADLSSTPDLFPVLAVLCAGAEGVSRLHGAPHLKFKESNRLAKTSEILNLMGVPHTLLHDGMEIEGHGFDALGFGLKIARSFDPDQDHRLAMAAQLANWMGAHVEILDRRVVDKSFPGFFDLAGVYS